MELGTIVCQKLLLMFNLPSFWFNRRKMNSLVKADIFLMRLKRVGSGGTFKTFTPRWCSCSKWHFHCLRSIYSSIVLLLPAQSGQLLSYHRPLLRLAHINFPEITNRHSSGGVVTPPSVNARFVLFYVDNLPVVFIVNICYIVEKP